MTTPRGTSHELENLAGLLEDFGRAGWSPDRADEAFAEIAERSLRLESFFEVEMRRVSNLSADSESFSLSGILEKVGRGVHLYLFHGILTTAGRYRRATDPGGGFVAFGGTRGQTTEPLFRGAPARDLPALVPETYARLVDVREGALASDAGARSEARLRATDAAVLFYKDLSGVHPFYDANGRVGRYVVSVYLLLHGRTVRWADLDRREAGFLKKINECLKRRGHTDQAVIATYEDRLVRFWRPFVEDVPDVDDDGPPDPG